MPNSFLPFDIFNLRDLIKANFSKLSKENYKKKIDYQKSKQVLNFPMHRHRMSIFKQTFPLIMWYLAIN